MTTPSPQSGDREDLPRMSLLDHLEEFRRRILWSIIALFVGFLLCFGYAEQIYELLARPIHPYVEKLSFLRIQDPLIIYIKVAALAAVFLTSPFLLFQAWRFVSPGLYRREKRWAIPFIAFGSAFFLAGGAFGYLVAFPFAVKFLLDLGDRFNPVITADYYFSFVVQILLGLGIMFELPIMIFMLSQLGIVTPGFLWKHFRWAVLIIFLFAAIITPTPDIFNLLVVATPTLVLYILGVAAAALAHRGKSRRAARAEAGSE